MSDDSMLDEFYAEAHALLEESEKALIDIENGEDFQSNFNIIFRAFHSIKGAAGMFDFKEMQQDFHFLENLLEAQKEKGTISQVLIDYFLLGIDHTNKRIQGEETSFELKNPEEVETAQPVENVTAIESKQPRKKIKKKHTIMIVDDEEEICDIIASCLEDDYNLQIFNDPTKACDWLQTNSPDLVFTDFQMPQMTGLDLTAEAHKVHPHLPIILVSGYLSVDVCIQCLAQGASGFVTKPFELEHLVNIAQVNINKYQSYKVVSQSINCLFYQFPELEEYLDQTGQTTVKDSLKSQMKEILENFRKLQKSA
jgi:CheY-like chemotaxis protein